MERVCASDPAESCGDVEADVAAGVDEVHATTARRSRKMSDTNAELRRKLR
jgi:hypothetical protein